MSTAMMAITTKSSISVKAVWRELRGLWTEAATGASETFMTITRCRLAAETNSAGRTAHGTNEKRRPANGATLNDDRIAHSQRKPAARERRDLPSAHTIEPVRGGADATSLSSKDPMRKRQMGRSSDFRIALPAAPSRDLDAGVTRRRHIRSGLIAAFVPGYSGGTATELHRFPYSPPGTPSPERHPCRLLMLAIALRMSTALGEGRGKRADRIQSSLFGLMKLAKSLSWRSISWSRASDRVSSTRVAPSVRPS